MRELSEDQVTERLQELFRENTGRRHLVFWFDDQAEFEEDVEGMMAALPNVKLIRLTGIRQSDEETLPTNQFKVKYTLEAEKDQDFLIYAPFKRPEPRISHLEDMILYSPIFKADKISLVMSAMGISDDWRPLLEAHSAFFSTKDRRQKFMDMKLERPSRTSILLSMLAVITKNELPKFDKILTTVLSGGLSDNEWLKEFEKYNLAEDFWEFCNIHYGYERENPNLRDLALTFFVTSTGNKIHCEPPAAWKYWYLPSKGTNMASYLDDLMNNKETSELFDTLSDQTAAGLTNLAALKDIPPEMLIDCEYFRGIDTILMKWIEGRLLAEDTAAKMGTYTIPELCSRRKDTHFNEEVKYNYEAYAQAWIVLGAAHFHPEDTLASIAKEYTENYFQIDQAYRKFYMAYDRISQNASAGNLQEQPEDLRNLVENIYTKDYLGRLLPAWNDALMKEGSFGDLPKQIYFYSNNLKSEKEKIVVFISDGLRYEVGREVFEKLSEDAKAEVKIDYMVATLPCYTRLGMEALLPHQKLELYGEGSAMQERVDGTVAIGKAQRRRVLMDAQPASECLDYDELMSMNTFEQRNKLKGKQIVYIYHDSIDVVGEHDPTGVFPGCRDAVNDLVSLIRKLGKGANVYRFLITSDHGFLYKRDGFDESEKIGGVTNSEHIVKRRYILADKPVEDYGICHMKIKDILPGNENDPKIVSFPRGLSVFKTSGGLSYVHGGSSPQELLIPLISVKMARGKSKETYAGISAISNEVYVHNREMPVILLQNQPVGGEILEGSYAIFYADPHGEPVSDIVYVKADSKEETVEGRMKTISVHIKEIEFDTSEIYTLKIVNQKTGETVQENPVHIDIAYDG